MPKKEIVQVNPAAANANLSPATKFGNLVFVSGQTGRHLVTGEVGKDIREQTRNVLERIKLILGAAGTSLDNVLTRSEERRVGKGVDLGGRRIIKKKNKGGGARALTNNKHI